LPRRVGQFGRVVDDATEQLVAKGIASTKGLRSSAINGRYGRYMTLAGVPVLFVCETDLWAQYGSPFWAFVNNGHVLGAAGKRQAQEAVHKLKADGRRVLVSGDNDPCIEIRVPIGVERDRVADAGTGPLRSGCRHP
jgi:hypothetical protein